jgi:hypothetical protein
MKKPGGTATQKRPAAPVPASNKKPETLPETTEGFPWPSSHEIKKESNPFTDRDWRMLAYAWSGLAVRLAIIFTLAFSAGTEARRTDDVAGRALGKQGFSAGTTRAQGAAGGAQRQI